MKKTLLLLTLLLLTPCILALPNLEIEKTDKGSVIIAELNTPAVYEFVINNKGEEDNFEIYSLVGLSIQPKGMFTLPEGKTTLEVKASLNEEALKNTGFFSYEYQIRGQKTGIFKDLLMIKVVPLIALLEISAAPLSQGDSNAEIKIRNLENTNIEKINIKLESVFFETEKELSLKPYEELTFQIPVEKEKTKTLLAGPYVITSTINLKNKEVRNEGIIDYLESEGTSVQTSTEGLIIKKKTVQKTNFGNTPITTTIEIKKDFISRLFTINSNEPSITERNGLLVTYLWETELAPAESVTITSTTNYTLPFLIIILAVIAIIFAKMYSKTALVLNKKVSLVKTKGGEFALRVTLNLKAKKSIGKVQLVDTLPKMTKLYEKFGKAPDKIDKEAKKLFWSIPHLAKGEE